MSEVNGSTAGGRRIAEVDMLRGFALFGILVTNAVVVTSLLNLVGPEDDPRPRFDGGIDLLTTGLIDGFFLGRFYLLFAFLFGYSFTLQIAAARRADVSPRARLLRRCGALFAIGLAHVLLLWIGDILTLYAVLCLILILLRTLRPRAAVITGVILYVLYSLPSLFAPTSGGISDLAHLFDLQRLQEGFTGSFSDTLHTQLAFGPLFLLFTWVGQGVPSLALFLLGMAAGKRRLFEDGDLIRRWTPRVLWAGFGVGVPVSLITWAVGAEILRPLPLLPGVQELVNPLMTFAYMAVILRLARSRWASAVARLAPAGRMAATDYIGQSVVFMLVYSGYGLALADDVPPLAVVGIALVTFAAQLWFSAWWLRGHAYGPVEWVLRAATYLTRPCWRAASPAAAP
ncbi:uncharacterized protein BJY24_006445 [Nocardia transvalensis]|uniref:DUF418 domain-containing protein n=1 Tax=Nocardia transvalensis TaxID=37333 RepID=A0A7W9PKU1_9NOCA|nr:DUF418 domain-containing protein [Nocardia transvalensis]MBB5917533.1 uncharacterized protein [Nocardia transvalensis]